MFPGACGGHGRQIIAELGAEEQLQAAAEKQLLLFSNCTRLRTVEPSTKKDDAAKGIANGQVRAHEITLP